MITTAQMRRGAWPCPVYVATLATGETVRLSFFTEAGKPVDVARGRRVCQRLCLTQLGDRPERATPYRGLLAGAVEYNDTVTADPLAHFTPDEIAAEYQRVGAKRRALPRHAALAPAPGLNALRMAAQHALTVLESPGLRFLSNSRAAARYLRLALDQQAA